MLLPPKAVSKTKLSASAAAGQHILAEAAGESVGRVVADESVGHDVARAVDGAAADQDQVLDFVLEMVVDGGSDGVVGTLAGELDHHVAGAADDIGVVAGAAVHRVGAQPAVEPVLAPAAVKSVVPGGAVQAANHVVAGDDVVECVADGTGARKQRGVQHQVLDIVGQSEGDGGLDHVDALAGGLDHGLAGPDDQVVVVAGAAMQLGRARPAPEDIVAAVAIEDVEAGFGRNVIAIEGVVAVAAVEHVVPGIAM